MNKLYAPEYDQNGDYNYAREVPNEEIIICEIKYTWYGRPTIDYDLQYLMGLSERSKEKTLCVFGWLTGREDSDKIEERIREIVEKTKETPLTFLVGRGFEPFRWGYYVDGVEHYYISSE